MEFRDRLTLSESLEFRTKIRVAILKVATDVAGEVPTAPVNIVKDEKRHVLATAILNPGGVALWFQPFAETCAALGTLTPSSTGPDVESIVTSIWNDMAGLTGAERGDR